METEEIQKAFVHAKLRGGHIEHIVEEMRREDMEHQELPKIDSSDDEDVVLVSAEWNDSNFAKLVVSGGYSLPWEYHENEVVEGAVYTKINMESKMLLGIGLFSPPPKKYWTFQ